MPRTVPSSLVPVRASDDAARNLAAHFGQYRRTADGHAFYFMTVNRAEKFRLVRDAGFECYGIQKCGTFCVPSVGLLNLNLAQAVAVGRLLAARGQGRAVA